MAKLPTPVNAGWNAGRNYYSKMLPVDEIETDQEIAHLFVYDGRMLGEITQSILEKGFDKAQPITVWKTEREGRTAYIVVDGHTRLAAAKAAQLAEVPVTEMEFEDKGDAILYTYERQVMRRNLTQAEILTATEYFCGEKHKRGEGSKAQLLAEKLGISKRQVLRATAILKDAPPETIEAVKSGEKSLNAGYMEMKVLKSAPAEVVEQMESGAIDVQTAYEMRPASQSDETHKSNGVPVNKKAATLIFKTTQSIQRLIPLCYDNGDEEGMLRDVIEKLNGLYSLLQQKEDVA